MKLRNHFHFWSDRFHRSWSQRLYSVPMPRGLVALALTGWAGGESFLHGSPGHQWLVVLMSILTVMHLIDSSAELRELELEPDPDATVFAGIPARIPLLPVRGAHLGSLEAQVLFPDAGVARLPEQRVVRVASSGLFRYWRWFRFPGSIFVLPAPRDHGVLLETPERSAPSDPDELVPIRDPALLPMRDPKIFRKTGLSVLRARSGADSFCTLRIDGSCLAKLPDSARFEQLSYWIREIERRPEWIAGGIEVRISFWKPRQIRTPRDWRNFKQAVARAAAGGGVLR